jgi:hypothetical protein
MANNYEPLENVRFFLHIYPWKTNFPSHGSNTELLLEEGTKEIIDNGVLSMQIHRSKDNPYGTAVLNFFGPIPPSVFPGNWCVIRSYDGVQNQDETNTDDTKDELGDTKPGGIVRFFGQIYSLNTSYQVNAGGGLVQHTNINVREWSFLYSVPVRYDSYAMLNTITDTNTKWAAQYASTAVNKDWDKLASAVVDPFQFCALTLKWIGALSNKGLTQLTDGKTYQANFGTINAKNLTLPDVALLLPRIPRGLLKDLGVTGAALDAPLAGDLVVQQFGIQGDCSDSYDSKLGAFKNSASFPETIEEAEARPLYSNIMSVFVNGQSAWELLNQGCDKFVNEIFTDLVYYKDNGKIVSRPLLVFRDKPFMMQKYLDLELSNDGSIEQTANWSAYDNLPRVDVPAQTIERADFTCTITDSPNYIRAQFVSQGIIDTSNQEVLANLNGTLRLPSEMLRFGGQTLYIQTPYTSSNGAFLPTWYRDISTLTAYWDGLLYRMPAVQLIVRDTNICFTVGFNVRFKFNDNTFVGHLKNYSVTYSRNAEGTHKTTTVLNLERVVLEYPSGDLDFIPEFLIRNIYATNSLPSENVSLQINSPFESIEQKEQAAKIETNKQDARALRNENKLFRI